MKKSIFIILGVILLGSIMFSWCDSEKTGTISGTAARVSVWPPDTINVSIQKMVWPPDTIFIVLSDANGKTIQSIKPAPCWPPDTCYFMFADLPFGKYKVAAIGGDALYQSTQGKEGDQRVLSYYFAEPEEIRDPVDWDAATFIELNNAQNIIRNVDIKYSVQ